MRTALLLPLLTCASIATAQNYFNRGYGLAGIEDSWCVRQTADGGFVFVGSTNDTIDAGDYDAYLVRTDADGTPLWGYSYGHAGRDIAESVAIAPDGGFVMAGNSHSWDPLHVNHFIVKTDDQGLPLWAKTYGDSSEFNGLLRWIEPTPGGYIAVGECDCTGFSTGTGAVVMLLDGNGDTLSVHGFDGESIEMARMARNTADGGYIVAGKGGDASAQGAMLLKLATNGTLQWGKVYNTPNGMNFLDVQPQADGGFATVASTIDYGAGGADILLIRTDAQGDTLWTRTYGTANGETANYLANMPGGGFVIAGMYNEVFSGKPLLLRVDANGNLLWHKRLNGNQYDQLRGVIPTSDGGFAVTGNFTDQGNNDLYLIHGIDAANGCNTLPPLALNTGHAPLSAVAITPTDRHVPVTVFSRTIAVGSGVGTTDVCTGVGLADVQELPLLSAVPNPTSGALRITLPRPLAQASISLRTPTGATLLERAFTGTTLELALGDRPPGVYLLTLRSNEGTSVQRLVLDR